MAFVGSTSGLVCTVLLAALFFGGWAIAVPILTSQPRIPASVIDTDISHTCAVELVASDTALRCWGNNEFGQSTPPKETNSFLRVSVGIDFGCATRTNLSVVCWGNLSSPERIPPRGEFLSISTKTYHSCGLTIDQRVVCWGRNLFGETNVPEGLVASDVSVGESHSCAIERFDGKIVCWGSDLYGQSSPPPDSGYYLVAAGFNHTCALHQNGTLACFGLNREGQATPPRGEYIQVSAGANHSCGRRADFAPICWGSNLCPDGRACNQLEIPSGQSYISLIAGAYYTCGVNTVRGRVNCWGLNDSGQTNVPPFFA